MGPGVPGPQRVKELCVLRGGTRNSTRFTSPLWNLDTVPMWGPREHAHLPAVSPPSGPSLPGAGTRPRAPPGRSLPVMERAQPPPGAAGGEPRPAVSPRLSRSHSRLSDPFRGVNLVPLEGGFLEDARKCAKRGRIQGGERISFLLLTLFPKHSLEELFNTQSKTTMHGK